MFARDFWRTGRWHTLIPGDPGSDFYWVQQPGTTSLGTTGATIRFVLSAPCQAYLEWATSVAALGGANDFTNAPGEESFTYSSHTQVIDGLLPATTYYLRAVVTDALGHTLTSSIISFTTTGTQPPPPGLATAGPRFDLYGAGASGDFPAVGERVWETDTAPWNGASKAWTTGNRVYVVPATAAASPSALGSWIINSVPDGASSTDPTYVVFDRSHAGDSSTQYGAGTLYGFSSSIPIVSTRVFHNVVFWGYNSKLQFSGAGNPLFWFDGGGLENVRILGFEIAGWLPDLTGYNDPASERRCISVTSYSGLKIMDCYLHNAGDWIALEAWYAGAHYWGWAHGPYSNDCVIAFNEGAHSGNQGILQNQGWNVNIHHNIFRQSRQSLYDQEDPVDSATGAPSRRLVNLTIADNEFRLWSMQLPRPDGNTLDGCAITFTRWYPNDRPSVDTRENVQILRNAFYDGPGGSGNPVVEAAVLGNAVADDPQSVANRGRFCIRISMASADDTVNKSITVSGNVSYLPSWAVALNGISRYWGSLQNWAEGPIVISDNNFQDMDWRMGNVTPTITWSSNGSSSYDTT